MHELVYKIVSRSDWEAATSVGRFAGSADDLRDGFMHFSSAHQLAATAEKYFAGRADLVLIAAFSDVLGPALRYERSRGGDLFPHLYADLPTESVSWVRPLLWQGAGFVWPSEAQSPSR